MGVNTTSSKDIVLDVRHVLDWLEQLRVNASTVPNQELQDECSNAKWVIERLLGVAYDGQNGRC